MVQIVLHLGFLCPKDTTLTMFRCKCDPQENQMLLPLRCHCYQARGYSPSTSGTREEDSKTTFKPCHCYPSQAAEFQDQASGMMIPTPAPERVKTTFNNLSHQREQLHMVEVTVTYVQNNSCDPKRPGSFGIPIWLKSRRRISLGRHLDSCYNLWSQKAWHGGAHL